MRLLAKSSEPLWIKKALKRLVRLAETWGIEVVFAELDRVAGEFVPDDMEISIEQDQSSRSKLNYLLHELGHAQIHLEGLTRDRYIGWDDSTTPRERLSLIEEEFEAWHRGRLIARRMGIVLDESYEEAREVALMSYVRWCARDPLAQSGERPTDATPSAPEVPSEQDPPLVEHGQC